MTDDAPALSLRDVRFRWRGRAPFSLQIPEVIIAQGEKVLLLGDSGSGKSTLLSLVCGTVVAESGEVRVMGTDLSDLSSGRRDGFRAEHVGVIFQQFNLLPFASVLDNILLPLRFAPNRRTRAGATRETATDLCRALSLPSAIVAARAAELSVGQQQRVAVARALIGRPPLLIADEPTSALDAGSQTAFLDLLFEQVEAHAMTLLMVSHDARLSSRFDRVLHMDEIATVERQAA
ncbi:ABC transporter ATP-binding protein [Roseobacter cerasinus]|uniref:ABC transporter ATP-binding protein n=1 Tax=Roseobacter cerasinus TaxID=2602289 RepID=A0A640VRI2_9RHOB|nr:ABC transporter ATP-binding protein [Roseobacter cerasinus]GFE50823.1 ABC transporter ATP-binding protein [Roseobacter cerasinus]